MKLLYRQVLFFKLCSLIASPTWSETINIAYNSDWPPYSFMGPQNQVHGILVDLLDTIFDNHFHITPINYGFPWKRVQSEVKKGTMDAFITVPTDERLSYTYRSVNIVYTIKMQAITRNEPYIIQHINHVSFAEDFQNFRVCEIIGNGWGYNFWESHQINFHTVPKASNCLQRIVKDYADLMIQAYAVGNYEVARLALQNKLIILPKVYGTMKFTLLLSKKSKFSTDLIKQFDYAINELIETNQYQTIIDQAISHYTHSASPK
ncbi:substrate-binding periplasmic protein [Zooshikella sp. RANM57]|uniref:substrate-binding periplasmic protein n=1 Tax=Zooshikella sp. RANM57 TaxID=3425863 RepID=UPI003D6FD1A2